MILHYYFNSIVLYLFVLKIRMHLFLECPIIKITGEHVRDTLKVQ